MTDDDAIRRRVRELAEDNRADCKSLLDLAAETNVPPARIGEICNELGIKITDCQLGCFR